MDNVDDLIRKAGGPKAISDASARTVFPVSTHAVHKWRRRGIPNEHWDLVSDLSGIPVLSIHKINQALRECRAA